MPRVQLDAAEIDHPRKGGGVVDDREHGRVSTRKLDELLADVVRMLRHALLVEEVRVDAVRIADHVKRPAPEMRERAVGDVDVVGDEVALREPARREEHLLRVRDGNVVTAYSHLNTRERASLRPATRSRAVRALGRSPRATARARV